MTYNPVVNLVPLGGCGEIGMNMTILQIGDVYYFIDCGVLFPDASQIAIDLILPDTTFLDTYKIKPTAWLITHGHEDHIGALPHIYSKYPAPIYGTRFTLELIKSKFEDANISTAMLNQFDFFQPVFLPKLKVTPFPVNHSIADAAGLFMETPQKNILHMGDFRVDYNPPEKIMTHESLKKVLRDKTVHLMMSDSTNSFQVGRDASEIDTLPTLTKYFSEHKGAVIVATFSSNVWRFQNVIEAAKRSKRKIALLGRSMLRNALIAKNIGLMQYDEDILIEFSQLKHCDHDKVCILSTGSQGEVFSGLHRLTWKQIPEFEITSDDLVIFSARMIPGNEKSIDSITTQLARIGAKVVTGKDDVVHVSGHGYQEDQKLCIQTAKPKGFLPVHGTYRHLKKHRDIAIECGVPQEKCFLAENGDIVAVGPETLGVIEQVPSGRDYVCPGGIFSANSTAYRERLNLVRSGVLSVSFVVNNYTKSLMNEPVCLAKGLPERSNVDYIKIATRCFDNAIATAKIRNKLESLDFITEELRIAIRRQIENIFKYKCTVMVLINTLG